MSDPRTKLVGDGYDAMVDTWEDWAGRVADDPRHAWASDLAARLNEGDRILELGCGGGTRETREFAARFEVTGVDLSERQLERARARIHSWLVSPGWLMTAFGTGDEEQWTGDFLGAPTFFSSSEPTVNTELVKDAGFTIERDEVVSITEPEGPVQFQWILARR